MIRQTRIKTIKFSCISLLAVVAFQTASFARPAPVENAWTALTPEHVERLEVSLNKSRVLQFDRDVSQVSIANPEIADILVMNSQQMYVLGKSLGSTNILVLDPYDNLLTTINLEISHDLEGLRHSLKNLMPKDSIKVSSSQGSIVLSGYVSGQDKIDTAVQLAETYLPQSKGQKDTKGDLKIAGNKVINLLKVFGSQQVMLEVQVAEISRSFLKTIDADLNLLGADQAFRIGAVSGGATISSLASTLGASSITSLIDGNVSVPGKGLVAGYAKNNVMFNAVLNVAKENGLAKILSEPTLTTLSGKEARFVSGGEFPIPVPEGDGKVGVVFKEYGVTLRFLPKVLDSKRINLDLDLAVSELSNSSTLTLTQTGVTGGNIFVPSLTKRSVQNTVELNSGQTLGIAGLISDNVRETVNKFPGLAKIPGLGALFRSQEFIKGQTELVVFVTPHLVYPQQASLFTKPTAKFVEPSDQDFYLKGKLQSQTPSDVISTAKRAVKQIINKTSVTGNQPTDVFEAINN